MTSTQTMQAFLDNLRRLEAYHPARRQKMFDEFDSQLRPIAEEYFAHNPERRSKFLSSIRVRGDPPTLTGESQPDTQTERICP